MAALWRRGKNRDEVIMDGLIEGGTEQREEGHGRTGVEDLSLFKAIAGKRRVQVAVVASAVEEIAACSRSSSSSFGSSRSSSRRFPSLPSQRPLIHF